MITAATKRDHDHGDHGLGQRSADDTMTLAPEAPFGVRHGAAALVRAAHVATLADERGGQVWSRRRFHNRRGELDALTADVGPPAELPVVMEPTRNAWAPVAAYFLSDSMALGRHEG